MENLNTINLPVELNMTEKQLAQLALDYAPKNIPTAKTKGDDGYRYIHECVMSITKVRGNLEKRRKELKADALAFGRNLDGTVKGYRETLESLEAPWRKVKTDIDEAEARADAERVAAEQRRVEEIEQRIAEIKGMADGLLGVDAATIEKRRQLVQKIIINPDNFGDYVEAANLILDQVMKTLQEAHAERIAFETQQAEQAAKQAELDAQQAKQEAAQAEQQRLMDAQQAEMDKAQRELDEKKAAQQATEDAAMRARLAEEHYARQEAERKEREIREELERKEQAEFLAAAAKEQEETKKATLAANKKHIAGFKRDALKCFEKGGLDAESAKTAVDLIGKNLIAHVSINY